VLELSEKQLVREIESGGEFVHAASDHGCRIALDGFVTGGKGSFLLKRFPIDLVKLGSPFVAISPSAVRSAARSTAPSSRLIATARG
jgi:EAL domain-containing protein (putative c-di-GMP-specific phosphodiesterase class I)